MHLAVYCASSAASETAFGALADAAGDALARAGHILVYGGGSTGLMGRVARAVHAAGGHVVGVIPESMTNTEIAYEASDELIVVNTMRERKQLMDDRSDAFLILPGGFGTLEELSEVITHAYLGYLGTPPKPIVIVNPDGFYDPLLAAFDRFVESGMAKPRYREVYAVVETVDEAMTTLINR